MSIASRITSIEGHIGDIYDSVELTGVDTTDIDKNLVNVPNTLKEGYIDIINNGTDTLYNNFPKVSGEGTSLTLNNTYQAPMRNNLKGNTSQTGTPTPTSPIPVNVVSGENEILINGKNLFDKNSVITGKYYTSNGTTTSTTNAYCELLNINENETYSIKIENKYSSTVRLNIFIYDTNMSMLSYMRWSHNLESNQSYKNENYTMPVGAKFISISVLDMPPTTENIDKVSIMFNLGSTSLPYEPYQGNTYNIDLRTSKNLFNKDTIINGKVLASNGALNDASGYIVGDYIRVKPSTQYTVSFTSGSAELLRIGYYKSDKTFIERPTSADNPWTITTPSNCYYIRICTPKAYTNVQCEEGSQQTTYEEYNSIELCKIGNYQDYFYKDSDKWYLHKEIGKVVLNGSESWQTISSGNLYYITGTGIKQQTGITQEIPMLSNRFIGYSYQTLYDALVDYGISSHTTDRLCIRNKDITSVANLKTWLGNNNTIVYFPLATPTNELVEYQPLIDQLNELEKAISYENQTNISQINNDLGFIISASALKKG